jgi:hypothetical protein
LPAEPKFDAAYLKNIRQLWDALMHIGVPANEIKVLDETNHLD